MKKRIISLLLTLVMLMSLCAGLGTSASAETATKTVTLQNGDTVLKLCQRNGVDFYANKQLIMSLNGFTSEGQFNKLSVGQQIVLPDPNGTVAAAATTTAVTTAAATTALTTAATTAMPTGTAQAIPAGDYTSYYLVSYTVQPGQTIGGIYSNWGLSYRTYDNQIKKLNNIASYNSIQANTTLLLPTTNPAMANSAYYTVMAHVMKNGESASDIVCSKYGLNYSANRNMLMALNNTNNLDSIQAGTTFYIPVAGLMTASSVVSTATSTTTTSAQLSTSANYNLVSQNSSNGVFDLQVEGKSVSTARAGSIVRVVATPDMGYTLDTIRVVKVGDASTVVGVSGTSFTMPSYSVIVSVTFKAAKHYDISIPAAVNGSAVAMVNGVRSNGAYVGNTVSIKTIPATGFMLDNVRVTYNNGRDSVAVYNNVFTMPDTDVAIIATFKKDPNYDPTLGHAIYCDANYGKVRTFVGNTEVSTANAGERVTVEVTPDPNYTVQSITVYYDEFKKTADIDRNSFTMPNAPVTIVVVIKPTVGAMFDITKVSTDDGKFETLVDGKSVTSAKIGANVIIKGTPKSAAYYYLCTVTKTGDSSVAVPVIYNEKDGTSSFVMPDYPVSVRVKFYRYHKVILDASNGTYGSFAVVAGNNKITTCAEGVNLTVNIWGVKAGYAASNVILTYADGSSHVLDRASFIMPDCDVKVKVNFSAKQTITAHSITVNGEYGKFGNTYTVGGKTLNGNKAATVDVTAGIGANVIIVPNAAFGYEVDQIFYTYTNMAGEWTTLPVSKNLVTGNYQFEMPALKAGTKLDLYVSFKPIVTNRIEKDYTGNEDHKKGSFDTIGINKSAFIDNAVSGAKIRIVAYPASGYKVDSAKVKVINLRTGEPVEVNMNELSFFMPGDPVRVTVPFVETAFTIRLKRSVTMDGLTKGKLSAIINGVEYTDDQLVYNAADGSIDNVLYKFETGTLITIINSSKTGYALNSEQPIVVYKWSNGLPVSYKTLGDDHFSFEMPDADVVVEAQYIDDMVAVNAVPSTNGTYSVPKQVAWNGKLTVTDIHPADGYELDKILVTYVDGNGASHLKEELKGGTTLDLSNETSMLKSDITVEVFFRPALNPVTIEYTFDADKFEGSNYNVKLMADGVDISSTINRSGASGDGKDRIYKYKDDSTEEELTGNGILTGATVVISRDETGMDKNFRISNVLVKYRNNESSEFINIKPEFSGGYYYFTMPYIPSGVTGDMVITIQYVKDTPDMFTLTALKRDGSGDAAVTSEFTVGGTLAGKAKVNDEISLNLTLPDEFSEITEAYLVYTNRDGKNENKPLGTVNPDGSIDFTGNISNTGNNVWTITGINVPEMPNPQAVNVEYVSMAKAVTIDMSDFTVGKLYEVKADGTTVEVVDEFGSPINNIAWGKIAEVELSDDGSVPYTGNITVTDDVAGAVSFQPMGGGKFRFTVPKAGTVTVAKDTTPVTLYNVTAKMDDGSGNLIDITDSDKKVILRTAFGEYTNATQLKAGDVFEAIPYMLGGYGTVETVENATDNGNGTYTVDGTGDVTIKVTFAPKTYALRLASVASGISNDFYVSVNGEAGTPCTDATSHVFTKEDLTFGSTVMVYAKPDENGVRYYNVKSMTLKYSDINGVLIEDHSAEVSYNADGSASFIVNHDVAGATNIFVEVTFVKNANYPYTLITTIDGTPATSNSEITVSYNVGNIVKAGTPVTASIQLNYYWLYSADDITITFVNAETGATDTYVADKNFQQTKKIGSDGNYVNYTFSFLMPPGDTTVALVSPHYKYGVNDPDNEKITVTASGCTCVGSVSGSGSKFTLDEDITVSCSHVEGKSAKVRVTFNTDETKSFVKEFEAAFDGDKSDVTDSFSIKDLVEEQLGEVRAPKGAKVTIEVMRSEEMN